ncbi:sugar transferase, partial [Candidatus Peregrinibacteria bacterium]|nr:sugar transferase [Candidatus Peregrinibacteria bacterium]
MKKSEIFFGILRVPLDALAVLAVLLLSYKLRALSIDLIPGAQFLDPPTALPHPNIYLRSFVFPGVSLFLILASSLRLYSLRMDVSAFREIGRVAVAACLWLVAVMAWYFLLRRELFYSRVLLLHATVLIALAVVAARALLILLQRALLRTGIGVRSVLSVGARGGTGYVQRLLEGDVRYRYLGHARSLADVRQRAEDGALDVVLHADPHPGSGETEDIVEFCRNEHVGYACLPPLFADTPHRLTVEYLGLLPLLRYKPTPLDGWGRVWKRGSDVALSALLLVLFLPFLVLLSLLIVMDSGFPMFYVSRRIGAYGRRSVPVLKFRTMVADADGRKAELASRSHRRDGPLFKVSNDPRVTRVGRILRRWSLDELPQLLNVLAGHLSLVGPRPHLPEEV